MRLLPIIALACLAGCSAQPGAENAGAEANTGAPAAASPEARAAQGVAQRYLDALGRRDFEGARALWANDGAGSGGSAADLARAYAGYAALRLTAGEPSAISRSDSVERITVAVDGSATMKAKNEQRAMRGVLYLSRSAPAATNANGEWRLWASDIRRGK